MGAIAIVVATGCATKGPQPKPKDENPKPTDGRIDSAQTKGGEATRYTETEPRQKLWTIRWGAANIEYNQKGQFGGDMEIVTGELYKDGAISAKFVAKRAKAAFGSNALAIDGGIEVDSEAQQAKLRCDRLVWNPDADRIEASGTVTLDQQRYRLGPFDAVYCSPNLDEVASPDMFRKHP